MRHDAKKRSESHGKMIAGSRDPGDEVTLGTMVEVSTWTSESSSNITLQRKYALVGDAGVPAQLKS